MSERFPDFDVDRARGEEAEALYKATRTGILIGEAEVKRDDEAAKTGRTYIEYQCQTSSGWQPSGIATTRATTWVIVFWPITLAMPSWLVRNIAREAWTDERNRRECKRGSHPTRGVVIGLDRFLLIALEHVQRAATDEDYMRARRDAEDLHQSPPRLTPHEKEAA